MEITEAIFYIAILVMSVVIHEVAHGFMALRYGDRTALLAGRLTLNPIKHLDPLGSVILPAILVLSNAGFLIGWAKPVPYNPNNLSDQKWGSIAVAAAGILANLVLAIIFGLLIRFGDVLGLPVGVLAIFHIIVLVNLMLAIFNMVPIPPLDGSKIFLPLLPGISIQAIEAIERYGFILLLVFVFYFSDILLPILSFLYQMLTGVKVG